MTSGSDAYLEKSAIEGGGLLLSEVAEELKELNQSLYPDVKKDEGHETKCEQE
jgi:hypothetical protein